MLLTGCVGIMEAFVLQGINVIQTSDTQLFRLQLLHLLFEELLSGSGRRGGRKNCRERSVSHLCNLMSKNRRSWRLLGRRRFHHTCANPSALHRNKRLDVICLFLASQQGRDGEGLGTGWRNTALACCALLHRGCMLRWWCWLCPIAGDRPI